MANIVDTDDMARNRLIWICTGCTDILFGLQGERANIELLTEGYV